MVRAYMQTYRNMDISVTHCANNYGPYQVSGNNLFHSHHQYP